MNVTGGVEHEGGVREAAVATAHVLVFDDGSDFAYLDELKLPSVQFLACNTFEELDKYVHEARRGRAPLPDLMALDVHCELYADFGAFGLDIALDANRCGLQLYEYVLRPAHDTFCDVATLFFTSYPAAAQAIEAESLSAQFRADISSCTRVEFRRRILDLLLARGLISADEADKATGLTQFEYADLFRVLALEFEFADPEQRSFLGVISSDVPPTQILEASNLANERIDILLAISVILDTFADVVGKRTYLQEQTNDGRRLIEFLLGGSTMDLLRLKAELEFRIGGGIL